ncbi:radical SAM family heme chaperone HemW [Flavobacteriaceae bacterium]|nr:radical SAM family heme chaperone HemW [Flavobacteriaceae bacterium]MDB9954801.1 radical SAM family heme chaperone HemW [Flavobacteriaceae bacterium]MDC1265986.1 radical SAM family heme chaperone HemW [Flavobacteriaceae bacterium]
MSGIYIHIPFCKKACHYCNFHFSTNQNSKSAFIKAVCKELILRKSEYVSEEIESIYFGGGTPTVLEVSELEVILQTVYEHYKVTDTPEITLEANPDDLDEEKIKALSNTKINRLSIGIQSFHESDLTTMNRAHNATEAKKCLEIATTYFDNITIDLMFGMPTMSVAQWRQNLQTAFGFGIKHLSCYALTVEPKTALAHFINKGSHPPMDDELAAKHFEVLLEETAIQGLTHYETCSFGHPDYFSRHNTSYWLGKTYMGVGPSAHSFDGVQRSWNVSNNSKYIKSLEVGVRPFESEVLSVENRFNEYIMTGLRTIWGVSLEKIETDFGVKIKAQLLENSKKFRTSETLILEDNHLKITRTGKFLSDGIASDLFLV